MLVETGTAINILYESSYSNLRIDQPFTLLLQMSAYGTEKPVNLVGSIYKTFCHREVRDDRSLHCNGQLWFFAQLLNICGPRNHSSDQVDYIRLNS